MQTTQYKTITSHLSLVISFEDISILFSIHLSLFINMDIAGSIVGFVSLGITLCDGIFTYCQNWKHQDDDVRSLTALCESSKKLLEDIDQSVKNRLVLNANTVRKLEEALQACTERNEAVLQLARKYTVGPTTTGPQGKAQELFQKLKFPFKKQTLLELKDVMIDFRGNVDTALGLLKL
jgi:hypothetical protein